MEPEKVKDVVCGMIIDPAKAAGSSDYKGQTYYFCSKGCKTKFDTGPERYLAPAPPAPPDLKVRPTASPASPDLKVRPTAGDVEYTCPMHPAIVQIGPGSCPICGMALEPRTVSLEDAPNPELTDMTRRFWIAAALTLPVFVLAMSDMLLGPGLGGRLDLRTVNIIALVLTTPVVWWAGWPFFERMWASVVNRSPNMFTLIGMGVGAAYFYSAAAALAPQIFPDGFRMHGAVETYFDTAAVIT